jgi:hypothetical protein
MLLSVKGMNSQNFKGRFGRGGIQQRDMLITKLLFHQSVSGSRCGTYPSLQELLFNTLLFRRHEFLSRFGCVLY